MAKVWDIASGKEVTRINEVESNILSISFSYDGSQLITSSGDKKIEFSGFRNWQTKIKN